MSLRDDVASFASQLGLSSVTTAKDGGGFEDSDFRPKSKAKRKREKEREARRAQAKGSGSRRGKGEDSKPLKVSRKQPRGEQNGNAKPRKANGGEANGDAGSRHVRFGGDGGHSRPPVGPDPNEQRAWNEGAGPIPDSLLGDAPASMADELPDDVLAGRMWFEVHADLSASISGSAAPPGKRGRKKRFGGDDEAASSRADALRRRAEELASDFTKRSEAHMRRHGGQDAQWLLTAKAKGTVRDKIAAASLLVQQDVVANLSSLEMLVGWVARNKGNRDGIAQTVDALGELFSTTLLPDRKLRYFSSQPAVAQDGAAPANKLLIVCYIEDRIKALYNEFLDGIEQLTKDNLEFLKQKAIKTTFTLLKSKPEQESRLLGILVNKLGDPSRKMASNAVYLMHSLLEEHPGMKLVVVQEVENFLFRPGLAQRAQYTSVIFLNQIVLSKNEFQGGSRLAEKLINLYFSFFQILINPAKPPRDDGEGKKAKFGEGKGGKGGGKKGKPGEEVLVDSKILGALLTGANRAFPYVSDTEIDGLIERHSPKLFQLVHGPNFGTCVQALTLLYQLYSTKMSLSDRYYRALYSVLLSPDFVRSNKAPLFLSLLFKSLKADVNKVRVATFLNRLMQVTAEARPNFTCGSLLLISETMKHFPALWAYVNEGSSGKEKFEDVREDSESEQAPEEPGDSEEDSESDGAGERPAMSKAKPVGEGPPKGYDMLKRDPQHSGMDETCFWELSLLSSHFHPSTAVMARTLLAGTHIEYSGDPLKDLSAVNFLSKFVQKKAKAVSSKFSKKREATDALPEAFAEMDESLVDPADLFHYYNQRLRGVVRKDKESRLEKEGGGGDDEKLMQAMLAHGGEDSDDSGEVSGSISSDGDEGDEDSEVTSGSGSEDSEDEPMEFGSEDELLQEEEEEDDAKKKKKSKKKSKASTNDGPFAPAADYEQQIKDSLTDSKAYLKELLEELGEED